jgi:hypothetical protein
MLLIGLSPRLLRAEGLDYPKILTAIRIATAGRGSQSDGSDLQQG